MRTPEIRLEMALQRKPPKLRPVEKRFFSRESPQSTAAVMKDDAQDSASRGSIDAPHQLAHLYDGGAGPVLEIESTLGFLRPLLETTEHPTT